MTIPFARRGLVWTDAITVLVCFVMFAIALAPVMSRRQRSLASADACAEHLGAIARAMASYVDSQRYFPPSYVYGAGPDGVVWDIAQQAAPVNPSFGYVHWSGMLLAGGFLTGEAVFQCPDVPRGGAPAANPGPVASNWEPGQLNDLGGTVGSPLPNDRQAKRMSYTGNGAILPRNSFQAGFQPRRAELLAGAVRAIPPGVEAGRPSGTDLAIPHVVREPSATILATEFAPGPGGSWNTVSLGGVSKSHRPITPFVGLSTGTNVYAEPTSGSQPRFAYPSLSAIVPTSQLGEGAIDDPDTNLNAVGRHHPGETANFVFIDGSVRLTTVQDTVRTRAWGERFWTITGDNRVR